VQEFKSHDQQENKNKPNDESELDSSFEIQDYLQESSPVKPSPVKSRLKLEDQVIFYRCGLLDEKSTLQTLPKEIEKPVYLQFNKTQSTSSSHNFGPMKEHTDSIQRIKRRLKDFRQGAPYCADQAARREGIDICHDIYTCGVNILAIRDYIKSTRSRLYQKSEDLFITKKSQYCVLNIRGVEVAYGFGPNCKRKAFDHLEYFLRENSSIHVVSALRHNGVRTEPQLTLALTPGDRQVGYILPANDAGRIPTGREFVHKPKESNVMIKLSDLTLFMMEGMDCPLTILSRTASLNKMQIIWEESERKNRSEGGGTWEATVSFDKTKIADGNGKTKKDAKADAASNALRIMLEECRVFEERKKEYAHENALGLEEVRNGLIDKAQPHLARMAKAREKQAKKTNKGAMLMRLMGWTGGGLGVEGNGIDKPVDHNAPRYGHETHGLGVDDDGRCQVTVEQADILISRYAASQISEDLSFSTDLGKEERKAIHVAVSRYGLRSKSYGKGADRYLVVSRSAQQKLMMLQEGCTLSQASLKQ